MDFGRLILLGGIIIQLIINKFNKRAGAVFGVVVTLFILIWGMSAYAEGNAMAIFSIELSQTMFIVVCLAWFGYDAYCIYSAFSSHKTDAALDAAIADNLQKVETLQNAGETEKALSACKIIMPVEVKRNLATLQKSSELTSFNKALKLLSALGMDAAAVEGLRNGMDSRIANAQQYVKLDGRNLLLGFEKPELNKKSAAFNAGKSLQEYIANLPGAPVLQPSPQPSLQSAVCPGCGEPVMQGDRFCTKCGTTTGFGM